MDEHDGSEEINEATVSVDSTALQRSTMGFGRSGQRKLRASINISSALDKAHTFGSYDANVARHVEGKTIRTDLCSGSPCYFVVG